MIGPGVSFHFFIQTFLKKNKHNRLFRVGGIKEAKIRFQWCKIIKFDSPRN